MLIYIDYLDHITSGKSDFQRLALCLKFDFLIFGRKEDTFCMSVPACVKVEETTKLLTELTTFWKQNKIVLQLDKKHKRKAANYFSNRKIVLARGMSEEQLVKHFEFIAYESSRTSSFFDIYLPEVVDVSPSALFIKKKRDTDALFRMATIKAFDHNYDDICRILGAERAVCFTGITNRISSYALDKSILFQRALIEESIVKEFQPFKDEQNIIATLLDRSFAHANAKTSDGTPLSLILNQLTGKWLIKILSKSYRNLFSLICSMSWDDIYLLSQDNEWQRLITYINAYIAIIQQSFIFRINYSFDDCINKLSRSISLLSLLRITKTEAFNALKNKFYDPGITTAAQNLEVMIDLVNDANVGKHRRLLDVLTAIDLTAIHLEERIRNERKYSYLISIGYEQQTKHFNLLL